MSRIGGLFARKNPVFIGFTVAGDPDRERSFEVAATMIDAGVDLLEIAVPYSDPVADGPVIERAHVRALRAGTTPDDVFALVRRVREHAPDFPIILFTYYNIVHRRGVDRFFTEASAAGADGVLIVDLPAEESGEVAPSALRHGIDRIVLIAPTTSPERRRRILRGVSGFVYLISLEGVTGERDRLPHIAGMVGAVREETGIPLAVGFGVSSPEHVRTVAAAGANGVIVGSALVRLIEEHLDDEARMQDALRTTIRTLRDGLPDPDIPRRERVEG